MKNGQADKPEERIVFDGYTRDQLSEAFNLVRGPSNWKMPIGELSFT